METHRQEDFVIGAAALARSTGALVVTVRIRRSVTVIFGSPMVTSSRQRHRSARSRRQGTHSRVREVVRGVRPGSAAASVGRVYRRRAVRRGPTGRTASLVHRGERASSQAQLFDVVHAKLVPLGDQALVLPAHGAGSVCGSHIAESRRDHARARARDNSVFTESREAFVREKGSRHAFRACRRFDCVADSYSARHRHGW